MQFLRRVFEKWRQWQERSELIYEVRWDDSQIVLHCSKKGEDSVISSIAWTKIIEIRIYNVDLFSYDSIAFGFGSQPERIDLEISEDDLGFYGFLEELNHRFSGLAQGWYVDALNRAKKQAFVRNERLVWQASS